MQYLFLLRASKIFHQKTGVQIRATEIYEDYKLYDNIRSNVIKLVCPMNHINRTSRDTVGWKITSVDTRTGGYEEFVVIGGSDRGRQVYLDYQK